MLKIADMSVEALDVMGTDLSIVNAARVSFNKESDFSFNPQTAELLLKDSDAKLLKYLAEHNHWSPFSHAFMSFRIKAPIFVARQLVKHQVGLSWNEVSRRYVTDEPEFYFPSYWRKAAENVKQGSSDEEIKLTFDYATDSTTVSFCAYQNLLDVGVCPEQARMVLPQNTMTEWIWSGSLYAFARVCNLRLDSHTQRETQEVAKQISHFARRAFPESWKVLVNEDSSNSSK